MQTVFKKETDFQIPLHNSIIFFVYRKKPQLRPKNGGKEVSSFSPGQGILVFSSNQWK